MEDINHVPISPSPHVYVEVNTPPNTANVNNSRVNPVPTDHDQHHPPPQTITSPRYQDPGGNAAHGEEMGSVHSDGNSNTNPKVRWNNREQARHWFLTFNNYTEDDANRIQSALSNSEDVVSAIIGKEVGASGTPHLQGYIHFVKKKRQSTVHAFFDYKHVVMNLETTEKPLAAFRYCMKEDNYYVVGKNLDEIARAKTTSKAGTGKSNDDYAEAHVAIEKKEIISMVQFRSRFPKLAAQHEEYFRGLIISNMDSIVIEDHPLRPWQQALNDRLKGPLSDREVIFVVDKEGNTGKSHFADWYAWKNPQTYLIGADKRDDISYQLINEVVENGPRRVVFMDAPRSRNAYISSSFLEELKNGKIISPKYKSKRLRLPERPHAVVMTNSWPIKDNSNGTDGLSDDRYTYLLLEDKGETYQWFHGYRQDEGGATAPGFDLCTR